MRYRLFLSDKYIQGIYLKSFIMLIVVLVLLTSCIACSAYEKQKALEIEKEEIVFDTFKPEEQNMDSRYLLEMDEYIANNLPHIQSVIIMQDGKMIFEKYYQGYTEDDIFRICSATKTITSALVGVAVKEGFIESVDQKIAGFFKEYMTANEDPQIREITIKHLLTMTSGLDWNENQWGELVYYSDTKDLMKFTMELRVSKKPGEIFNYNTLGSQLLSGIITKASKMSTLEFAKKYLFGPLGITKYKWDTDKMGFYIGGADLYLRTRDMAKIGQLYLNDGIWDGKRILPEGWVAESTSEHNKGGSPHNESYGYHCWVTTVKGYNAFFAGGYGGQFIFVVPDLKLAVAITSYPYGSHHEENRDIVGTFIIPSIKNRAQINTK